MTTSTLPARPTLRLFPLYHSELSRLSHRRLFRILALLLLAGIVVVSGIVFFVSRSTSINTTEDLERNRAQEQNYYNQCVESVPTGKNVTSFCGRSPADEPLQNFDYHDDRTYRAMDNLPAVVLATSFALAGLAFIVGASTGGAEWSSRSMTLQLLWEPRRLRLLATKWLALVSVVAALGVIALALALGLGAITASLRGTWDGHVPSEFGSSLGAVVTSMGLHGLVVAAFAATFGFAIAILVRNTGASLGAAFVYFAIGETALRLALMKYGPEPFMLSTNTIAFMIPAGLDVPGAQHLAPGTGGGVEIVQVHLSNLRSFVTLLGYTLVLVLPAGWSFARRDIG